MFLCESSLAAAPESLSGRFAPAARTDHEDGGIAIANRLPMSAITNVRRMAASGRKQSPWWHMNSSDRSLDKLLPAVNVVGRAGKGRVGHDVHGERSDVGRLDDAADRKRGTKLIAAAFELIAEERCR